VKRACVHLWVGVVILFLAASAAPGQQIRTHIPTTQKTQAVTPASTDSLSIIRVGAALIGVVSLIFLLKWCARGVLGQTSTSRAQSPISVVARSNIAPRQQIVLVQVGRRLVLVGNSGGAMNALCEIKDPDEVSELLGKVAAEKSGSIARTFGNLFRKEEEKFGSDGPKAVQDEPLDEDQQIGLARQEIHGLMEKVRGLSTTIK
jgi:flagellar biogenesis protein FliO